MYVELLRHGQPEGEGCLRGITDFSITPEGLQEMKFALGVEDEHLMAEAKPDLIISSPLKRCADFASWLSRHDDIPLSFDSDWQEMNFGLWDGKPMSGIFEKYPEEADQFWRCPANYQIPDAESYPAFMLRISSAWETLLTEHYGENKKLLIVTHSGVMRQILHYILQLPEQSTTHLYQFSLPYAAKIKIRVEKDKDGSFWSQIHWPSCR